MLVILMVVELGVEVVVLIVMEVEVVVLIVEVGVEVLIAMVLWETVMAVGGFTLCDHRTEDRGRPCLAAGSSHQEVTLCDHNHHTLNGSTGGVF